jgi:hypothetical protein
LIGGGGSANYGQITGGATTKAVEFKSLGTDTNVAYAIQSKGTGAIDLAAGSSGVNISNGGTVTALTRTSSGSNYTSIPSFAISAPTTAGGVQATASPRMQTQTDPVVVSGGTGYTVGNVLTVVGGTGSAATFTVSSVSGGVITAATRTGAGDYTVLPINPVSVTGGTGSAATFNITLWQLQSGVAAITNAGSGYVEQPTVTFSGGGGSGAAAYATVGSGTVVRSLGGTMSFVTPGGEQTRIIDAGTATDYLQLQGGVGGSVNPSIQPSGSNANTNIRLASRGTGSVLLLTNSAYGQLQAVVAHTASAVNYVQVNGAATGGTPQISAQGSDANAGMQISTKGSGTFEIKTNNFTQTQLLVTHTASAVNRLSITGGIAGAAPVLSAVGSDTDIDLTLTPKGAGNVRFGTYTAGVLTPTGYITVKDSGGTTRRLLVG